MRKINVILFLLVLTIALAFINMPVVLIQKMQTSFLSFLSPAVNTILALRETISSYSQSSLHTPAQLQQQIRTISIENAKLRATIRLMQGLQEENDQLRSTLAYCARSVFHAIPARVSSHNTSTWWHTILINRGFQDGIELNMPVVTERGLVGKITTVGKGVSTVLLITDENCKVAATVEGSCEKGIVSGPRVLDGRAVLLELNFLSKDARIEAGKRVYTAGVNRGVFPSGVLIGTVKCTSSRELDSQAKLEPAVDLSYLEDVFVIAGTK